VDCCWLLLCEAKNSLKLNKFKLVAELLKKEQGAEPESGAEAES